MVLDCRWAVALCAHFLFEEWQRIDSKGRFCGGTPLPVFFIKSARAHENTGLDVWTHAKERKESVKSGGRTLDKRRRKSRERQNESRVGRGKAAKRDGYPQVTT